MLCTTCSSIFDNVDVSNLNYENKTKYASHQTSIDALQQAANDKCYVCTRLLKLYHARDPSNDVEFRLRYQLERLRDPAMWLVDFFLPSKVHRNAITFYVNQIKPSAEADLPWYKSDQSLPNTTNHDRVFLWAKTHLNKCSRNHHCALGARRNWSPPRLLDVRNNAVRLFQTSGREYLTRYATLSHCWGPNPSFFVLTSGNLSELHDAVPYERLPKTFQDAIVTTRNLGLPYLWIDSLCILQSGAGSEEDWQLHGRLMSDIYANCTVNIAADFGASSEDGLFVTRDPDLVKHPIIKWLSRTYQLYDADNFSATEKSILSTRGWVFQERLLSPRIIHFGSEQVSWECRNETTAFESLLPMVEDETDPFAEDIGFNLPDKYNLTTSSYGGKTVYDYWNRLVEQYSERNLTRPDQDKLVAIAGVAERMSTLTKDSYIAGFFEGGLLKGLLWTSGDSHTGRTATRSRGPYRAPSWSWASVDGRIKFPYYISRRQQILATVLDHHVDLVYDDNPYGQVSGATLTLRAPLYGCTWQLGDDGKSIPVVAFRDGSRVPLDVNWKGGYYESYFDEDGALSNEDTQFALTFINTMEYDSVTRPDTVGVRMWGLALAKENLESCAWKRIGTITIVSWPDDVLPFQEVYDNDKLAVVQIV